MKLVGLMVLAVAAVSHGAAPQNLFEGNVEAWPGKRRTLDIPQRSEPGRLHCAYRVTSGEPKVRLAVLRSLPDRHREEVQSTLYGESGSLTVWLSAGERYRLVMENEIQGKGPASLTLTVDLEPAAGLLREPSPQAKAVLIGGSLTLFAMGAVFAGVRIAEALRRRPPRAPADWGAG